jgi:hypothetical protein
MIPTPTTVPSGFFSTVPGGAVAAIWSAIAATFSAVAAITMALIHRRNLIESVRPELVIGDWERSSVGMHDSHHDVIRFSKISNYGRDVEKVTLKRWTLKRWTLKRWQTLKRWDVEKVGR